MGRWTFDLDIELGHGRPASCWTRPVNADDGLEVIVWIRFLGGERLPTASYALRPNPKKLVFSPREEGSRLFVVCFLHTSQRYTFDLGKESTHGQPASCRARPVDIDDRQIACGSMVWGARGCPRCPTLFAQT